MIIIQLMYQDFNRHWLRKNNIQKSESTRLRPHYRFTMCWNWQSDDVPVKRILLDHHSLCSESRITIALLPPKSSAVNAARWAEHISIKCTDGKHRFTLWQKRGFRLNKEFARMMPIGDKNPLVKQLNYKPWIWE